MARVEVGCSGLLKTSYRFVVTELGGCAVDIDNEHDLEVARLRYDEWTKSQYEIAARMHDALPEKAGGPEPEASEADGGG